MSHAWTVPCTWSHTCGAKCQGNVESHFPGTFRRCPTFVQVIRDKNSQQSRGFAFVTFAHPQTATNAQAYMNGMTLYGAFGGRSVRVGPSNRASSLIED